MLKSKGEMSKTVLNLDWRQFEGGPMCVDGLDWLNVGPKYEKLEGALEKWVI